MKEVTEPLIEQLDLDAETKEALASVVHEVTLWQRIILWPATLLFRLWCRTLRIEWEDDALQRIQSIEKPAIFAFWHNHVFLAFACSRYLDRPYPMGAIASASKDGAWVAALLRNIGMLGIRGSSHRKGAKALRNMHTALKSGIEMCITPDGSRGPCYYLRPGCIQLAKKSGASLLLCGATFTKSWRLKTWDRFHIPKPFSRVTIRMREYDAASLSQHPDTESARIEVETILRSLISDDLVDVDQNPGP